MINQILLGVGIFILGGVAGWLMAIYKIAKDTRFVRLENDQVIIPKPEDGYVLAQVTPEILRSLMKGRVQGGESEARGMASRRI